MSRKLLISIHLYLAAFFAPLVLLVAVSGGLYLLGYKGEMRVTPVAAFDGLRLDTRSEKLPDHVASLLEKSGRQAHFETLKVSGTRIDTRPSSRDHYRLTADSRGVVIEAVSPSFQAAMMELHKGHGPAHFKTLQKVFALGMILIVLSGLYLGLTAKLLFTRTIILFGLGLAASLYALFF